MLMFITEPLATRAVAIILAYGADLIIAAYILVIIAAIIFTIRRRMSPVTTMILVIGLAVLGYVVKDTFAPLPAAPYNWDAHRRRAHLGDRDRPAVHLSATAARDPPLAPAQSRRQRAAREARLR
jgi:hypothetical protein